MKTVWKFPLRGGLAVELAIPRPGNIVLVGADPATGEPAIWAEVEDGAPCQLRTFWVSGTGHNVDSIDKHIGSYVDSPFVWHVWEKP